MIFSAWRKHEVTASYVLTSIFTFISAILISQYLHTLEEFSDTPAVTYAQTEQVEGAADTHVQHTPSNTHTPTLSKEITILPSRTSTPRLTPANIENVKMQDHPPSNPTANITSPNQANTVTNPSILQALNSYRNSKGVGPLKIDEKLQTFAQSRADSFASAGSMDSHAGFQSMLSDNGFEKMGFNALGENSSYGSWESSQNLIENIYGNSQAHNESQLRSDWTHVGIGVKDSATNLVFGGKKR